MSQPWKNMPAWEDIRVPAADEPDWDKRYLAVLKDLDVLHSARYAAGDDKTFCNIFFTDFVRNMGLRAPTHWMTADGHPAKMGQGIEMSANRLATWFRNHGATYGWWKADELTASSAAERGHVVAAVWQSDGRRGPGHIAIVLGVDGDDMTAITQAGKNNFEQCTLRQGFGDLPVEFWIQAEREGGHEGHSDPAA